jgi:4-amino-4-deoxy-L-arabinose transferase-like glycosyltransferase
MPWLWLPATLALPWLLPAWWRDLKARRNTPLLMLAVWVLLVLLFFSLSSGKRSVYIFPAAPAFALIVGACARDLEARAMVRRLARLFPLLLGGLVIATGFYALGNLQAVARYLPDAAVVTRCAIALVGTGAAAILVSLLPGRQRPFIGLAASCAALWIGAGLFVAPAIDGIRSGRDLVRSAETAVAPDEDLGIVDWPEQFLLQVERPVFHFGFRREPDDDFNDAIAWLAGSPNRRVLVPRVLAVECVGNRDHIDVGRAHRRDWWLIDRGSLAEACLNNAPAHPDEVHRYARPGSVTGSVSARIRTGEGFPAAEHLMFSSRD